MPWWENVARQICKEFRLESIPDGWEFVDSDGNYARYYHRRSGLFAICSIDHMPHARLRHISVSNQKTKNKPTDEELQTIASVFFPAEESVYTLKRPGFLTPQAMAVAHLVSVQWGFEKGCDVLIRKGQK